MKCPENGFTLIEILVAMTITALIMVMMAGGLSLSIRSWQKGEEKTLADQKARIILEKISGEIASLYQYRYQKKEIDSEDDMPSPSIKPRKKIIAIRGDVNRFEFISTLKLTDHEQAFGGIKMISFSLKSEGYSPGQSLIINEKRFNPGNPLEETDNNKQIFTDGIKDLTFRYFVARKGKDIEGKDMTVPGQWNIQFKEEINDTEEELPEQAMELKQVLLGVEVTLSIYETVDGENQDYENVIDYPPLVIPVYNERKIKIKEEDEAKMQNDGVIK